MPMEPDYRELLQKAQQCTDEVKAFLVAVCNAPQGRANTEVLAAAALTVEHLRMVEGQISHIWELFEAGDSATHAPSLADPAPPAGPGTETDKPVRTS
jgi:hypothetical protein